MGRRSVGHTRRVGKVDCGRVAAKESLLQGLVRGEVLSPLGGWEVAGRDMGVRETLKGALTVVPVRVRGRERQPAPRRIPVCWIQHRLRC